MKFLVFFIISLWLSFEIEFIAIQEHKKSEDSKILIENDPSKSCKNLRLYPLNYDDVKQEIITTTETKLMELFKNNQNPSKVLFYGDYQKQLQLFKTLDYAKQSLKYISKKISCKTDGKQTQFTRDYIKKSKDKTQIKNNLHKEKYHNKGFLFKNNKKHKFIHSKINTPYGEVGIINAQPEHICVENYTGKSDLFDKGTLVLSKIIQNPNISFPLQQVYQYLFNKSMISYQCSEVHPDPGFDKTNPKLIIKIIRRSKRLISLNIYHEFLEFCVVDEQTQKHSYWAGDRLARGALQQPLKLLGHIFDTALRVIYVQSENGLACNDSMFITNKYQSKELQTIETFNLDKEILFKHFIQRTVDYAFAYPKYEPTDSNCQHFAKNIYNEIVGNSSHYTNKHLMSGRNMENNYNWDEKMPKRYWKNWYFNHSGEDLKKQENYQEPPEAIWDPTKDDDQLNKIPKNEITAQTTFRIRKNKHRHYL